jgi:hypothetical protein
MNEPTVEIFQAGDRVRRRGRSEALIVLVTNSPTRTRVACLLPGGRREYINPDILERVDDRGQAEETR